MCIRNDSLAKQNVSRVSRRFYLRVTREIQLSSSVLTLHILVMCKTHASFCGMLSRELPAKTLLSSIA